MTPTPSVDMVLSKNAEYIKTKRKTNVSNIMTKTRHWRNIWIDHIVWHQRLLQIILEGSAESINHRGRPKKKYMNQLIKGTKNAAWKLLIIMHDVANQS